MNARLITGVLSKSAQSNWCWVFFLLLSLLVLFLLCRRIEQNKKQEKYIESLRKTIRRLKNAK